MILKLKDIHQQICGKGNEWFDKRNDICCVSSLLLCLVDSLSPFLRNIEEVQENAENLVKMLKKIDAYTRNLEQRAEELCK